MKNNTIIDFIKNDERYRKGYQDAITDFKTHIDQTIKNNIGNESPDIVRSILNNIVLYSYYINLELIDEPERVVYLIK